MQSSGKRRLIFVMAVVCGLALACATASGPASARPAALSIGLQSIASGFRAPVDIKHANDGSGRLFVVEKVGRIRIIHAGRGVGEQPFLDIQGIVNSRGSEQGLLGLAFHPRYKENGSFYVHYNDASGDTVVAQYQVSADPNVADPGTGAVILFQDQPFANHNGGNLMFGPDGYLWIGLGDGGSGGDPQGNGQRGDTWLGKMLRIDVDSAFPFAVPPDNPYVGNPNVLPEVWAFGLRNPWRYTFDRLTGDLWIGDVGQNAWEEVNFVPAGTQGANFGWNVTEANHCFRSNTCDLAAYWPAAAEYRTGPDGCAVVSGYVYRGATYPAMYGTYLYGDQCSGRIWTVWRNESGHWQSAQLLDTGVNISSFGEDEAGEMYAAGYGDGHIYRITGE